MQMLELSTFYLFFNQSATRIMLQTISNTYSQNLVPKYNMDLVPKYNSVIHYIYDIDENIISITKLDYIKGRLP
jgi:hypothetical protein